MTERIKYEYSVIIEADVNDDIQHQHLSEELESYFNTYENKVVLGDYQFRIHELPAKSNKKSVLNDYEKDIKNYTTYDLYTKLMEVK